MLQYTRGAFLSALYASSTSGPVENRRQPTKQAFPVVG